MPTATTLHPSVVSAIEDLQSLEVKLRAVPPEFRCCPELLKAHTALGSYLHPQRRDGRDLPLPPSLLIQKPN